MTLRRCIVEFIYIRRLQAGLTRIPSDSYDNLFGYITSLQNAALWDDQHQAFIRRAKPVRVHSHNDFQHTLPLFEALGSGCISVEADVHWANVGQQGHDFYVGHTADSLRPDYRLGSLYLEPLRRLIETQNPDKGPHGRRRGIFDAAPEQTVVLLIDFKTPGWESLRALRAQLSPLRERGFLTYWNGTARVEGPLTIVVSGMIWRSTILDDSMENYGDVFLDADLSTLALESYGEDYGSEPRPFTTYYNTSNSYLASTEYSKAKFGPYRDEYHDIYSIQLSDTERRDLCASQFEQAKTRGLITRYYDIVSEPPNVQEQAIRNLTEEGVGLLNMDDLGLVRDGISSWGLLRI